MNIVIPMVGNSRRFKKVGYNLPKFLLNCGDKLMIEHVLSMFSYDDTFHLILNKNHNIKKKYLNFLKNLAPNIHLYYIDDHEKGPTISILNCDLQISENEEIIISYCDFTVEWDYKLFLRSTYGYDASAPYFEGFQAASLGNTYYAYMKKNNNMMKKLSEKKPFTKNRINEPASTGVYYFKSFSYFKILTDKLLSNQKKFPNDEVYVSLLLNEIVRMGGTVNMFKVDKFICFGTPEDYEQFNYWFSHFNKKTIKKRQIISDISLIPMAGEGKRFKKYGYRTLKPIIQIGNETLLNKCVSSLPKSNQQIFLMRKKIYNNKKIINEIGNFKNTKNIVIPVYKKTDGQVSTCLLARKFLEPNKSLMISSCDYELEYKEKKLRELILNHNPDVVIFTFKLGSQPIGSYENFAYCKTSKNKVMQIVEKKIISNSPQNDHMVTGTFWFRNSSIFLLAADNLISNKIKINNEYYVGTSINYLIKDKYKVLFFEIDKWISFGDPLELNLYYFWQDYFHNNP